MQNADTISMQRAHRSKMANKKIKTFAHTFKFPAVRHLNRTHMQNEQAKKKDFQIHFNNENDYLVLASYEEKGIARPNRYT